MEKIGIVTISVDDDTQWAVQQVKRVFLVESEVPLLELVAIFYQGAPTWCGDSSTLAEAHKAKP